MHEAPDKPQPSAKSWLDRLMTVGPRTRRWTTLATLWVVVTPGALLILLQPNEHLRQAADFEEKLRALKIEEWLAFALIGLHILFVHLAWLSYLNERKPAPPPGQR